MDTDVSNPSIGYTPFILLSIFVAAVTYYIWEVAKVIGILIDTVNRYMLYF